MWVECEVSMCVTTQPSEKCPEPCDPAAVGNVLVSQYISRNYTVRSGPVLIVDAAVTTVATTITTQTNGNTDH